METECVKVWINAENEKKQKKAKEDWRIRKQQLKVTAYTKENKAYLQQEINRLARMIDNRFKLDCVDCRKPFGKQQDAGHFHSVGAHPSLRFNLHNIHSQKSECNQYQGGRQMEYYEGVVIRYGHEYANYVRYGLPVLFPVLKLTEQEIVEKLALVRKIIRDFETFVFVDSWGARTQLNRLIGIYFEKS